MDDFVGGADLVEEAIDLFQTLHSSLKKYGFVLRKYTSNSRNFLNFVPEKYRAVSESTEIKNELSHISILGLKWCSEIDSFQIKVNKLTKPLNESVVVTRRLILSYLSRSFDPLGFLAPVTVRGKMLLQKVWLEGKSWDAPVSEELSLLFREYVKELNGLSEIKISRVLVVNVESEVVSFCDASSKLYAAVVYLRSEDNFGNIVCRLMCSKTRVAPLKEQTIPRLELQGAVLASELTSRVIKNLNISVNNTYIFSDSTIVLCWLSKVPTKWNTFVANRVKKVNNLITFDRWFYVNTVENPADDATRGFTVEQFKNQSRWFDGPQFLLQPNFESSFKIPNLDTETALERRKQKIVLNIVAEKVDFIKRFSSYLLQTVTSYRLCPSMEK
jgi:hypothetical protein